MKEKLQQYLFDSSFISIRIKTIFLASKMRNMEFES